MSSVYVRTLAELWANNIGLYPFYNTINDAPEPDDNIWVTMDFDSFGYTKETYCEEFTEDGEIRLVFIGRVGIGWGTLLSAAEQYSQLFYQNTDPNQKLTLTQLSPPMEYSGSSSPWFIAEVGVEYQLYL
jgi:hypothetical protein